MSELKIKDGAGKGRLAAVDSENRLKVFSTQESEEQHAIGEGRTWNITTGELTLTADTASAVQYVKNTGTATLIVPLYIILTKASSGGSGNSKIEILRNPTAGTVVSDANNGTNINQNFGASATPKVDHFVGGEGKTLTGQDDVLNSQTTASNRLLLGIITFLPTGASVGIRITPPSGNTSIVVESIMEIYEEDAE